MDPIKVRAASLKRRAKACRQAADENDKSAKALEQHAFDLRRLASDLELEAAKLITGERA